MNNTTSIKSFLIIKSNGEAYDMTQALQYMFINENLFQYHLLGFATILDSGNWLEKLPINSNCLISVRLISNSNNSETELTFQVTSITDIKRNDINKKEYNIQFVSVEAILNFNVRINKGYAGNSTAIVSDIMSNISKKYMITSKVDDDARILAADMHPYKAINLLNLYGSKNYYDFMFWENFRGLNYNRVTELLNRPVLHKLSEKDISGISDKDIMNNNEYNFDKENITNYYQKKIDDYISQLKSGELGSSTYTYNSLIGMPSKYEVNSSRNNNIIYTFNEDTLNYQNYGSRHKVLSELLNNELLVTAMGDYDRCTGDMCEVYITGASNNPEYTDNLSGNFLIMRIEHEFTQNTYKQTLGLTR